MRMPGFFSPPSFSILTFLASRPLPIPVMLLEYDYISRSEKPYSRQTARQTALNQLLIALSATASYRGGMTGGK
ncbi:hypothetical protein BDZ94DRAFT_1258131 [Collybia nuda]|uniref:Uncharacterized protein n=1 Tax=Collybia nuda TaxID=64659 RepID=A0A9P6CF73_9AGAR|nr:hypothetical protein BDZ94DRAFT_1258131 [Collybia nuda]